jgi:formate-dependent phosphoribosylglycinamide formyltransferase (GAR transformylase)
MTAKKQEALICIAAGASQLLLIKKAINLGYAVISVDINPNAIGFEFSTVSIISSTHDSKNIIIQLKKISNKFIYKGILNRSSGIPVITSAQIAKHFKINYYPINSAKIILNKHLFFKELSDYKIIIPRTQIISSNYKNKLSIKEFPLILKPSLSEVGKSGVIKVNSQKELANSLTKSFSASINDHLIAQEFIEGYDVVLISFVQNGELKPISFVEEINIFHQNKETKGVGVLTPTRINQEIKNKIIDISEKIVKNLKINTSPFMISFRVSENIPFLMELHLDFGGDLILDVLLPNSLNLNVIETGIKLMAGKNIFIPKINPVKPTSVIYHKGDKLNSEKKYHLIKKESLNKLIISVNKKLKEIYD